MKKTIMAMRLKRTKRQFPDDEIEQDYIETWINASYDPDADYEDDDEGFGMCSAYPVKGGMVSTELIYEIRHNLELGYHLML